jgi:uncharacterized membrane protein
MATLSVTKFPTPEGADQALGTLRNLEQQQLIQVLDAATVSWPSGAKGPKTHQASSTAGVGALGGAFWGLLFGLIFFVPLLGVAIGAGMGALMGSMADVGIDDKFIKSVRDQVTPGTSALFAMTQNAVVDRVAAALKDLNGEIIQTNLDADQEAKLREVFSGEPAPAR